MRYFDKRRIEYGNLIHDGKSIGACRCELITNEIDPDALKATISAFEGSFSQLHEVMTRPENFGFVSQGGTEAVEIKGRFPSISIGGHNDEVLRFKIAECTISHRYKDGKSCRIGITYRIPSASLYNRVGSKFKHFRKGLLFGWEGWRREWAATQLEKEWEDESYHVHSHDIEVKFSPIVLFEDTTINGKEGTVVVEQMAVECSVKVESESILDVKKRVDELVADFLKILSFLEGNRVDWHSCSAGGETDTKELIETINVFRTVPKFVDRPLDNDALRRNRKLLQQFHINLTQAFRKLDDEKKKSAIKMIDRFLVASCAQAIDTRLIYWHSCLDVLIKEFGADSSLPFSLRLAEACKKAKVEWLDIYPEVSEQSLDNKGEFQINPLRNGMLHHGDYPDNYEPVFVEVKRAKSLCERMIAAYIGVDWRNSGFSKQ